MIFADLSIYHSALTESPLSNLLKNHPSWAEAYAMQQVHGDNIQDISQWPLVKLIPECDGLISQNIKQTLIIKTADCVPIAISDNTKPHFAAIHAGRAGTEKLILKKTLQKLTALGSQPHSLYVYLGPSIGPCCYEINRETHEVYDLWKKNQKQALEMGLPAENIKLSGICTCCHKPKQYYSYRGGDLEKRFFTVVSKLQS